MREGRRDKDADFGKKKHRGVSKDGTYWEKVTNRFGYKLHLLVDSEYVIPLSYRIPCASVPDTNEILPRLRVHKEKHAELQLGL